MVLNNEMDDFSSKPGVPNEQVQDVEPNNKRYAYSEIFYSPQGEGHYTGYPTVWLRTFLCNLQCDGFGQDDPTNRATYDLPNTTAPHTIWSQANPQGYCRHGGRIMTITSFITVREFTKRHGLSRNLIYEQLRKGALPSVRLGGRILIPADALQQMMEKQHQQEIPAEGD